MRLRVAIGGVICAVMSAAGGLAQQARQSAAVPGQPAPAPRSAEAPATWARPLTTRTFERTPARLERGR